MCLCLYLSCAYVSQVGGRRVSKRAVKRMLTERPETDLAFQSSKKKHNDTTKNIMRAKKNLPFKNYEINVL